MKGNLSLCAKVKPTVRHYCMPNDGGKIKLMDNWSGMTNDSNCWFRPYILRAEEAKAEELKARGRRDSCFLTVSLPLLFCPWKINSPHCFLWPQPAGPDSPALEIIACFAF